MSDVTLRLTAAECAVVEHALQVLAVDVRRGLNSTMTEGEIRALGTRIFRTRDGEPVRGLGTCDGCGTTCTEVTRTGDRYRCEWCR